MKKDERAFEVERAVLGEVFFIISQGDKGGASMEAELLSKAKSPLAGSFETTADAATARKFDWLGIYAIGEFNAIARAIGLDWEVARHMRSFRFPGRTSARGFFLFF
jgi:hypothetical protein